MNANKTSMLKFSAKVSKRFFKNGSKLFKTYNYTFVTLSTIFIYVTFKLYIYLGELNSLYGRNPNYDKFLLKILYGGIFISIIFALLYFYSFLSYIVYPNYKKEKKEAVDALLLNFSYFFVFSILLLLKNDELYVYYLMLSLASIISIIYFRKKEKIIFYCVNCNKIIMKTLYFCTIAFFLLNIQCVIYSIYLIKKDITLNIIKEIKF